MKTSIINGSEVSKLSVAIQPAVAQLPQAQRIEKIFRYISSL